MGVSLVSKTDSLNKLLAFIQAKTDADSVDVVEFRQLTGGAIQENHGLAVTILGGSMPGEHRFVVRCNAPSSLSVSLTREQEFHVLQAAYAAGVTAPKPYWLCTDPDIMGGDFYIMQWADGSASPRGLVRGDLTPEQRKQLSYRLGQEMARLHQVRPPQPALSFLPMYDESPALHRILGYHKALQDISEPHAVLDWALQWLGDHVPATQDYVLCHCDFRTGNYMVHEGQLTALLDWEFASWSDPYEDLGWICSRSWRFGSPEREVGGVGDKADLFAGYTSVAGHQVDTRRVLYWEVMASVRWAVVALQQAQRHLSGQQTSLELALTGRMLPEIELDVLEHLRTVQEAA